MLQVSAASASPHGSGSPVCAAPFLKWAGGKTRLLRSLRPLLPPDVESLRYVEPFLGGGAMFFALAPVRAVLGDINSRLIATYLAVRDEPVRVLARLRVLARCHDEVAYYDARARYNRAQDLERVELAALFIYLNKTCFNGLHRVNKRGEFNVPVGRYANPAIADPANLLAASSALGAADVRCGSFETLLRDVGAGDFVYLDPPYLPSSRTASFTAYARDGFDANSQRLLRHVFGVLDRRGAKLMLSNSAVPAIRELYRGYEIDEVWAARSVNSKTSARGLVRELVIRNYSERTPARDARPSGRAI